MAKRKLHLCRDAGIRSGIPLVCCLLLIASPAPARAATDFKRDVQPIFAERCYDCHGPEKQKAGLRLDLKDSALLGGDSGKAIIPHKSAESLLVKNISGENPDSIMPPKGEPLTAAQVATIKAWIDEGAVWPDDAVAAEISRSKHWSFQPIRRPELPVVKNRRWTRQPIDHFILARLEQQKIQPAPEANKATLIRRLSLDLLGLPPSPEDVRAFLTDKSPDAYEKLVDRLLASPHYGERWGRHWLDLARYADSDGYEKDSPRPYAYLYRDWVINALNRDIPFDQFTVEQLAGDLLPNATQEQKIATGFHRQTLVNREGGVDQEEFRVKAIVDRVDTTGTVWLGLTMGCAQCHSHKYDPISQREFYQLFAFFNNADDEDLPAPSSEELKIYQAAKAEWESENQKLQKAYDDYVRDVMPAKQAAWEAEAELTLPRWEVLKPTAMAADEGTTLSAGPDDSISATKTNPIRDTYTVETIAPAGRVTGFRLEVLPTQNGKKGPGRSGSGNFVLSEFRVKIQSANGAKTRDIALAGASADFSQKNWDVAGAVDGNSKTGWAISPQQKQRHVAVFQCVEPLEIAPGDRLLFTLDQHYGNQHTLARFRLSATESPAPEASLTEDIVVEAWRTPPEQRTAEHKNALTKYFRDEVDADAMKLRKPLREHAKKQPKFPETKAAILVERQQPRDTHIHIRGDFLRPGDKVSPGTPAVLHAFNSRGERPTRLDLARWLMDESNPLTARVAVNHVWKNLFGRGLVATVNDFGTRGELPSHPELLDWLATEFRRLGWSQKALIKLIVTSATYRQSSDYRLDLVDVDPLNTLLARQNRLRLEAEIIRDVHLAASGLLSKKIGGPSVRPPLPADIAALGYANSVKWQESEGEDRYRRGMYIFFQRTVPYPMLMTFDAPDSNTTCTRRERSDTPLQALTLWNDPVFFDCARALAKRVSGESSVEQQLKLAFQICLAREPAPAELTRLKELYDVQRKLIQETPPNAAKILGLDEKETLPDDAANRASLVTVTRTIMNLDEFITRD